METLQQNKMKFYNTNLCELAAKRIRSLGDMYDLSQETINNAADQFEIAAKRGGNYGNNIISYPHFTNRDLDAIFSEIL